MMFPYLSFIVNLFLNMVDHPISRSIISSDVKPDDTLSIVRCYTSLIYFILIVVLKCFPLLFCSKLIEISNSF